MQITERRTGLYLTDITTKDFGYKNLGGRLQSNQGAGDKPSHYVDIKLRDPDVVRFFKKEQVKVTERQDYDNPDEMVFYVKFKAYPKTRFNGITGRDEVVPRIVLRDPDSEVTTQLEIEAFGEFDRSVVDNVNIKFHIFKSEYHGVHYIPVIDELWADQVFGPENDDDDYIASLYKSSPSSEEEVPFK